jgi:hypothetical protein
MQWATQKILTISNYFHLYQQKTWDSQKAVELMKP